MVLRKDDVPVLVSIKDQELFSSEEDLNDLLIILNRVIANIEEGRFFELSSVDNLDKIIEIAPYTINAELITWIDAQLVSILMRELREIDGINVYEVLPQNVEFGFPGSTLEKPLYIARSAEKFGLSVIATVAYSEFRLGGYDISSLIPEITETITGSLDLFNREEIEEKIISFLQANPDVVTIMI